MQPGCLALVGLEVPTDRLASVNVHLGTRTRPGRVELVTDLALSQLLAQVVPGRAVDQVTDRAVGQAVGRAAEGDRVVVDRAGRRRNVCDRQGS